MSESKLIKKQSLIWGSLRRKNLFSGDFFYIKSFSVDFKIAKKNSRIQKKKKFPRSQPDTLPLSLSLPLHNSQIEPIAAMPCVSLLLKTLPVVYSLSRKGPIFEPPLFQYPYLRFLNPSSIFSQFLLRSLFFGLQSSSPNIFYWMWFFANPFSWNISNFGLIFKL